MAIQFSPQDTAASQDHPPLPLTQSFSSTEQSQTSMSVFDNSLITDNILQYLFPKDTFACLKVNKAWYTHFHPYQWRSIAHYYTYNAGNHDPTVHPRNQWWESNNNNNNNNNNTKDDDNDPGNGRGSGGDKWRKKKTSIHTNSRSPYIFTLQRDLICSNAFRVRSLKMDYSAAILLDVPFTNLTRFIINCRYSHHTDPIVKAAEGRKAADRIFQEQVLGLISLNPRLRELEISYVYCWRTPSEGLPFSIRILQALQHRPSASLTTAATTTGTIGTTTTTISSICHLHSLKLIIQGSQSCGDICSIIENCPPSLQELTVQSSYYTNPHSSPLYWRTKHLEQRLISLKDIIRNHTATNTTNDNSNSPQRQAPSLRLLNVSWYSARDGQELDVIDSDKFLYPLLACFLKLQDLTVPKIPCRDLKGGATLISALTTHHAALSTINFGENFISEDNIFRFITDMPQALQGLTMRITPLYLNRVLPTLLQQWGRTLQVLRLGELGFANLRSTYIAEILTCCPRLRTLVVASALGKLRSFSKIGLQDLLGAEWVCSGLETLSISIYELAAVTAQESGLLNDGLASLTLEDNDNENDIQLRSSKAQTDQDAVRYSIIVQNVSEFCRRLKALPMLDVLDLQWSQPCQTAPFERGMTFSDNLLTADNLQWIGLSWLSRSRS